MFLSLTFVHPIVAVWLLIDLPRSVSIRICYFVLMI